MATEGDVRCGQADGTTTDDDSISGLPDDLLHAILLRLRSTPEAARTSVLSRRWRRIWATLQELSFFYNYNESPRPSSETVCRRINEALAAYSAPTVDRLEIAMPRTGRRFPPGITAPWLRFASQRLAGELRLDLHGNTLRFGMQASGAGAFTALSTLRIENGRMESRELEDVVSSRCPSLKKLVLWYVFLHGASDSGLRIRSDSLQHLELFGDDFGFDGGRLEVDAPNLRFFSPRCTLPKTRIVAPKLSEVCWYNYPYNTDLHHLVDVGRHLRRLDIHTNSPAAELMELFDTIEDLNLTLNIAKGERQYLRFLKNTNIVPMCETLLVRFTAKEHAFFSTMRHLLNKCTSIRKLELLLAASVCPSCLPCCPCHLPADSVTLDSLEEVEIYFFQGSFELPALIELLSNNAVILKKIVISYEPSSALEKEVREKIHRMCRPDIKVKFTVLSCWKRFCYYSS